MEFIHAYHTLGKAVYLDKAREMFDFAISGWSDELGVGIYWRERDKATKNTCSNGPAAVLALMLYQETKEQPYLDWANKILDWTQQLKSPDSGVYWDNMTRDGTVDKRAYTYNTGTPLHANALLYTITGEQGYLDEARSLAASSLIHFAPKDAITGRRVFPDTPWFNAVLLCGYLALYAADPEHDSTYVDVMRQNLDFVWENARAEDGSFSPDWTGRSGVTSDTR